MKIQIAYNNYRSELYRNKDVVLLAMSEIQHLCFKLIYLCDAARYPSA